MVFAFYGLLIFVLMWAKAKCIKLWMLGHSIPKVQAITVFLMPLAHNNNNYNPLLLKRKSPGKQWTLLVNFSHRGLTFWRFCVTDTEYTTDPICPCQDDNDGLQLRHSANVYIMSCTGCFLLVESLTCKKLRLFRLGRLADIFSEVNKISLSDRRKKKTGSMCGRE